MKKCYLLIFAVVFFISIVDVAAQDIPVRFATGDILTGNNIHRKSFDKADLSASLFQGNYFGLIQFSVLPSLQEQQQLKDAGIELGAYINGNAYLAIIHGNFDISAATKFSILSINAIPSFYKKGKALYSFNSLGNYKGEQLFAINYYSSVDRQTVLQQLQQLGAVVLPSKFIMSNTVFIEANKNIIDVIAALPFVYYIDLQSIQDRELNYNSTAIHAVSGLQYAGGRNLNGKGITVGVGDNSEISTAHVDFTGRVISRVPFPISFHGIHVTGTVAGGGILNTMYKGMAPRATIVNQYFSDIITNTPTYSVDNDMIATCNSYTTANDICDNGVYDALSSYTDAQMKSYENVLHVFAAGNDGNENCIVYPPGFATIKSGYQCAKNVLTVGAMNQADNTIAFFSSRGPVNDGRIKPEIVTSGYLTNSTRHNNTYGLNSGTSMAAPIVTGVTVLLNEKYRQVFGNTPKAALLKALMCNTAEDMGNAGPDFTWGFGMLNARRAVEAIEGNRFFIDNTATLPSHNIVVPSGANKLKVMLYWADPEAISLSATTLVNDLDLTVDSLGIVTKLPLVLDPTPGGVNLTAVQGADHTNNIEQVIINDPAAGTYAVNVSAFALPAGAQEYILTYQIDMQGVTVEYPVGGETLLPGTAETIRWSAFGDTSSTFTIAYDDGGGFVTINASVPATARSYNWTVPATATNVGRIKITRNTSGYTDQSDYTFTVLGQPLVTQTVPCEGYVQLNWGAITSTTSYDVWQLKGDTMTVIGNTAGTTFLVEGLNSSTTYWFAVSAKNGSTSGRRSVAVGVIPATGTCSLSEYDKNLKAVAITAPVSGRELTSSAFTGMEQVQLVIKNLDDIATTGSYGIYYQINGGSIVSASSSTVINSLATVTYTFAPTAAMASPGVYTIKAWVKRSGDFREYDDTATIMVKNLANPAVTLTIPLIDGFETTTTNDYTTNIIGIDGDDRVDFKTNSTRGRARTFVNSGFARNGNKAITLDQFPVNTVLVTDSLLMTYNAASYNGTQLRFDFYYKNHGQANNPNNKVWIRGSDTEPWVFAYDLVANQAALGQWKHAFINVNDVLDTVLPAQPISTSFQIKFGQQGNTSANDPNPIRDQDDGYTFDEVTLSQPSNDVQLTEIVSPVISGCNMAGSQTISVKIKSFAGAPISGVPVTYVLNGGSPVTQLVTINPGVQIFSFTAPVSFSANTDYTLDFYVKAAGDTYNVNDSILNYNFHTSAIINTYPYLEGFESSNGGWYSKGSNNSWQWGTPAKSTINKAANGAKAWVTGLTTNYKNNELSYLYSPCFDLTSLAQPVLSFSHIFQVEDGFPTDFNWVEYSTNGGVTWNKLGINGGGTNWYNDPTGAHQWRGSIQYWHVASVDIPVKSANMRFRIVMTSDLGGNYEGVGVDDIHIFDKRPIYAGGTLLNTIQNVSGSSWIDFNDGTGRRIASINANGQTLGSTKVDVYPYAGAVRVSSHQYYLNRNIVVRPTTAPASDVSVRLYFTDAEAKSLKAATGCTPCKKLVDPYELGVTKYSGTAGEENGTLADNLTGIYNYILPGNTAIIPYDNGYYAEFSVNSFSEFWLNNGGVNANVPLPLNLISFEAIKQNNRSLLQWMTSNEINSNRFIVERSVDGRTFTALGSVDATNQSGRVNYTYSDAQPISGLNYYRLKIVDNSGTFSYSPIRKVNFANNKVDVLIYPNPVIGGIINISASDNCNSAILYDGAGKVVQSFNLKGRSNVLHVEGIAKGIYQLKLFTTNGVYIEKVVVQ